MSVKRIGYSVPIVEVRNCASIVIRAVRPISLRYPLLWQVEETRQSRKDFVDLWFDQNAKHIEQNHVSLHSPSMYHVLGCDAPACSGVKRLARTITLALPRLCYP